MSESEIKTETSGGDENRSRWRTAMVGPLPPNFLRIDIGTIPTAQAAQMGMYGQPGATVTQYVTPMHVGRLSITCAQARLVRNYGITRMDPYVRVRVGHYVYETQTDPNGGKNPRWNRVIQSQLAAGVNSIFVEVYDECSFKMDELIAWCEIKIPENVLRGETHEEWYPLSGKQGEGLEGAIDIVLSFSNQPIMYPTMPAPLLVPPGGAMPVFVTPQHCQPIQPAPRPVPKLTDEDFKQFAEMFPNIDKSVVESVWEANRGNKDATVNSLLQMND